MLNKITKWWFEKTKHIIDNHMIMTHKNTSLVMQTNYVRICRRGI